MSKSFINFLGTAVICATIGIVTAAKGSQIVSAVAYVLAAITGISAVLLLINPNFFRNLHGFGVAWLISAAGFGVLAYYLKFLEGCGDAALAIAGISALSAVSAIGHGIYPTSPRKSSMITLALDPGLFVVITWIALSGINAPVEMFQADVADKVVNLPQQEFGVIDTMIAIVTELFRGNPVRVNGVLPFPQFFLLLHMAWNFIKVMKSYSWWFVGSSLALPFLIVALIKHVPHELCLVTNLVGGLTISATLIAIFSLKRHWTVEVS